MLRQLPPLPLTQGEERSAFARGPKERPLRLLVDESHVSDSDARSLLHDLEEHPALELWRYPGDGHDRRLTIQWGQIVNDHIGVELVQPGSRALSSVWPVSNFRAFAQRAIRSGLVTDEEWAYRQLVLAATTHNAEFDILVTEDSFLLASPVGVYKTNIFSPIDTVATVGLLLRSRNDFTLLYEVTDRLKLGRGLFYMVAAWEILPSAWRWYRACTAIREATGSWTIQSLAASAIERLERALRARDRLQVQLQLEQDNDTADEVRFYLDVFTFQLVGAFDAVARVAHIGLGVPGKPREAAWNHRDWRQKIRETAPILGDLMVPKTVGRDALDLLAFLRNTIHSEALPPIARLETLYEVQNLIELRMDRVDDFLEAIRRRGGDEAWGVQPVAVEEGGFSLEPGAYVESVLPLAAAVLDNLMRNTPVERFPNVEPDQLTMPKPPAPWEDPEIRRKVVLLSGLAS